MLTDLESLILKYLALRFFKRQSPLCNKSIKFGQGLELQVFRYRNRGHFELRGLSSMLAVKEATCSEALKIADGEIIGEQLISNTDMLSLSSQIYIFFHNVLKLPLTFHNVPCKKASKVCSNGSQKRVHGKLANTKRATVCQINGQRTVQCDMPCIKAPCGDS